MLSLNQLRWYWIFSWNNFCDDHSQFHTISIRLNRIMSACYIIPRANGVCVYVNDVWRWYQCVTITEVIIACQVSTSSTAPNITESGGRVGKNWLENCRLRSHESERRRNIVASITFDWFAYQQRQRQFLPMKAGEHFPLLSDLNWRRTYNFAILAIDASNHFFLYINSDASNENTRQFPVICKYLHSIP